MVSETIVLSLSGIMLMGLTCFIAVDPSSNNSASKVGLLIMFLLGAISFGYAIVDVIQWAVRTRKQQGKQSNDCNNRT